MKAQAIKRKPGTIIIASILLAATTFLLWMPATGRAAGLLIADGPFGGVLEIEEQTVDVTINNGIAVTTVEQIFVNTENRQVEALYTFPVPKNASVANFSMWIAGKEMIGEVIEKKRAREIYESYKQTRRDPGLLEQVDYKRFEMRIFPIPAGAKQRVQISYYQELDFDHDRATYVYPLATVTRRDIDTRTTGKFAVSVAVKSEVPIVEMASPSHRDGVSVTRRTGNFYDATLETSGGDLNRDFVLSYKIERPRTGIDTVAYRDGGSGTFCMMLTAGKDLEKLKTGMDYVFILDVSGSMANDGKLNSSVQAVKAFVETLSEEDRFEVMTFNDAPRPLFKALRPGDVNSRGEAVRYLEQQESKGSTRLRPAVEAAYRYDDPDRTLNVLILSDGMTEKNGQNQLLQVIQSRPSGSRVFCIGVGNEINKPLLSQIAQDAGGLAAFISRGDDFERQAEAFRRKLIHPAATNVQISIEGGSIGKVVPEKLPNLYHGTPLRIYGQYEKPGPVNVRVQADINGRRVELGGEIVLPATETANPELERMWAWHRIDRLNRRIAEGSGNKQGNIDEIVELGERYSIVTEYTSFLVLENDAEYKRWKIERRNLERTSRDRKAQERLRKELEHLRDQSMARLAPVDGTDAMAEKQELAQVAPKKQRSVPAPTRNRSSRSFDLDLPNINTGGGGAVDPLTGCLIAGFVGLTALAGRKSRKR